MLYLIGFFCVFALWMLIELLVAPKGYEDERGFHFGSPREQVKTIKS